MLDPEDEVAKALLAVLDRVELEDEWVRLSQMREFKKNNLFWHGFQYIFWSETAQDWRVPTHDEFEEMAGREETRWIYDYVINFFKAHGESIIGALSADVPDVEFGPADAKDPDDVRAVKTADNCVQLIERWNRAKSLVIEALFYLCTEGFCASYTYNRKDPAFGTINIPTYGEREEKTTPDSMMCPNCGFSTPIEGQNVQPMNGCPQCGNEMAAQPGLVERVPFQSGEKPVPKGREIVEVYGALSVRVPSYAAKQADCGYLIHYVDAPPAAIAEAYDDLGIEADPGQDYARIMRQSSLSMEGIQLNAKMGTVKRCWFRPFQFNVLGAAEAATISMLKEKFPSGVRFDVNGSKPLQYQAENMDEHWTLCKAGPSKGVHADPLLKSFVPIQEIRNNLTNLFVMQVEYGVPASYADKEVYDFEGQSRQEIAPGYVYPVAPKPGQSIADSFYTEKTTMLSKESSELLRSLDTDGQFVLGDYPSIYGGPAQSGSKTLGEYEKSRSFALQRLSLVWYFVDVWYGETMHKALKSFIQHQVQDESFTVKSGQSYETKWIRKAFFEKGSFDRLEPEVGTDFPVSFAQKRQILTSLFQLNNPEINSVLFAPENARVVQSYVGLRELIIPTEIQRQKQVRELLAIASGAQVPVEPDIDDHEVHITVIKDFLASDSGLDLRDNEPQVYGACLAHLLEHKQAVMATMPGPVSQPGPPAPGERPGSPPNKLRMMPQAQPGG